MKPESTKTTKFARYVAAGAMAVALNAPNASSAAASQPVAPPSILPNDGFVVLANPEPDRFRGGDVCPLGSVSLNIDGGCAEFGRLGTKSVQPVAVTKVLNDYLGAGHYAILGFAPMGSRVVVYFRQLTR